MLNKSINTSKTIKYISRDHPIEVVPKEIIFKDIQINQTYEITVFVRNLTQTARRIRVFQPHSNFRADYEMQGAIAAGLSMKLVVTFETASLETYQDSLKIVSDGNFNIDVPLFAFPPQAAIIFEPFINLGFVRVGKEKQETIYFKNEGKVNGKVELKIEKLPDFRIEPNSFTIQAGQEYGVKVYYKPREAGIFRGLVDVVAEGQSLQKSIDINATSIEFTRFLIDENGVQNNYFDFGTIYYGQQKQIETYLVNNTPKSQKFKVKLKKGVHQQEDALKLQTPAELGLEQNERIMECYPEEGVLESYSQMCIQFKCKARVSEEQQVWTRNFAMTPDQIRPESDEFHYSAIFDFSDNEPLMNHLSVRCICPTIRFPNISMLSFGMCSANRNKELVFEVLNKSNELPITIEWPVVPYFSVSPPEKTINPDERVNFWVSFKPKHTGNFATTLYAELLNGVFRIPLKVQGSSQQFEDKSILKRGPESLPQDFESQHILDESLLKKAQQDISQIKSVDKVKTLDISQSVNSLIQHGVSLDKIEELKHKSLNKEIYNEYLRLHRVQRVKKEKDKLIQAKYQQMSSKLQEIKDATKKKRKPDDPEEIEPPIDYEFVVGMNDDGYEPELSLPDANETLFVTKPIYHYEPIQKQQIKEGKQIKPFDPDLRTVNKKKFPSEPKTHTEIRDANSELNADQLQKISAGPVKLEFGPIYINSKMTKFFYVKNELRTSINVRIKVDKEDFKESYQLPQIIPSGQTAQFDISIMSNQLGPIKSHVKYIINEKHIFELLVTASIEKVQLEMNRQQIKFGFNEDNSEMETSEIIRLTNNGNADAKFKWLFQEKKIFIVNPESGKVPSGKYLECQVIYRPSSTNNIISAQPGGQQQTQAAQQRTESEKLTLKIIDGNELSLNCTGVVTEPKCVIKNQTIDFKEIVVCKQETKPLTIKNLSRSTAVFSILQSKLPDCIEVTPMKGKINQEEQRDLQIKFLSKDERVIRGEIVVQIRGGKSLTATVVGTAIIPKVEILEDDFDFGNITTLGTSTQHQMTLVNNSAIPVELVLDQRPQSENPKAPDGIDCLEIRPQDDDESILHSVHPDNEEEPVKEEDPLDDVSQQSEPIEMEVKEYKQYNMTLAAGKQVVFVLKFSPKEVKQYAFDIPIFLARYNLPLPSLTRRVTCKGLKPKFLVEPQTLEFKKKIISTPDKCFADTLEIKLSNPDKKDVHWRIDTTPLKADKIFAVEPSEGVVGSGQQIRIKVKFNPYGPGNFNQIVSLFILSDNDIPKNLPYVDLTLSGSGAYPRLLFDKKEVILPVVPLNVVSRCQFRIINDGYENLNLKYNWAQEIGNFNLKLHFPEGQTLGIAKSKLRVEVQFSHKKPLSFTTRVEFIDDARVYSINISGTTDNCLLTNQIFLQRMGRYELSTEERKPLQYVDEDLNVDSDNEKQPKRNHTMSVRSSTSSKGTSALGYTPVRQEQLDDAVQYIVRWLNYHVLTQPIQAYPEEVITSNGGQMFELLVFLTGKSTFPYKVTIDPNWKRLQKAETLFKQYDDMIRALKVEGALLNHIRPEYLLSYPDYLSWLKSPSLKDRYEFVPENMLRLNLKKFTYLQYDAWITLFYQIIKIYYLNRINAKQFKQLPGILMEKAVVPEYYCEGSNLISQPEGVLLWFFEMCYESQHSMQSRRLKNFDQEFRDSQLMSDALNFYIGGKISNFFSNMRTNCQNEDDFKNNADKLMPALQDYGLSSHIQTKDLIRPSSREMLMIMIQMYFSLPHYVPQKEPILFQCVLGEEVVKSIELKNPTNKPISYWVKYEGDEDFSRDGDESIKIDPDQPPFSYKIKFTSRVSEPATGRIIFTNKKETNVQAAALVFDLKSQITGRKSEKQWNVPAILYDIFEFTIQVSHKFQSEGTFQIILVHEKKVIEQKRSKKKPVKEVQTNEEEFPSFFCLQEYIKIKKGIPNNLTLTYIPLTMETHRCSIIFTDPRVGEFQHDIVGTVELPNIIGELKPDKPLYVDSPSTIPYAIPFKNEHLQKAKNQIQQLLSAKQTNKYKGDKSTTTLQTIKPNFPGSALDVINFDCEIYPQTQYLTVPAQFQIADQYKQNKKPGTENIDSKLPISYAFKNATKDFSVILTLKSKTDVRRYKLSATVLPKIVKALLEFRVPARQQIIQEIPIVNASDREWNIKVALTPDAKGLFSCPQRDFFVKRKTTGMFPITFSPTWLQECEAKLVLSNPITNDVFEYELKGYGEEPVAEEHIILNCQARKLTKREIELRNPTDKQINYTVETDLINAIGPSTISVPPMKKVNYILQVQPVLSGQYTGSITFTDEQNHYLWYTVFLNTESPKSVQTLEISCLIRQATVVSITLSNPLNEMAVYEVLINGDGLIGDETFAIASKKDGVYELTFAPLKTGRWRGSVAFVNPMLGEVWYELIMSCDEQTIQRLNVLKASLGKVEQQIVVLENPSDQKVQVQCRITNPTNFDIYPDELTIHPYDNIKVALRYTPSSLDIVEQSDIIFTSPIGKWHYLVFGQGLPPTKFPATTVSIGLNKDYSSVIHFKNPFKEPIQCTISLDAQGHNADVFRLLLVRSQKSDKVLVPGMNVLQVPFSFVPREITSYYCEVVIAMNEKIQWQFPVKGVTESVSTQTLFHFKAKCREKWEDEIKVGLLGIAQSLQADDRFDFELGSVPLDLQAMIQRCFTIKALKNSLESPHDNLLYFVRFQPMKPFKTSLEFIVLRQSGGRWKYKIQLEATEPEEDDVILISSPLNKTTSVSFKLTNKVKSYAKFSAAFSPDSDAEFSVVPKQGDLEPYGREGTNFIISFTPVEYGKIRKGKLIIQTEDMYWSYVIKGVLPRYVPPQAKVSMIDDKHDLTKKSIVTGVTTQRNYLMDNIRKSKQQQHSPPKKLFPTLELKK